MLTTVVGSYPAVLKDPETTGSKIKALFGSYDPYETALKIAVEDQVRAGVDIISDGQVRGDMIEIFARKIIGMTVENGVPKITGKIRPANKSLGASDLTLAIKIAENISKDYGVTKNQFIVDDVFNTYFKGVKGIVTGPTTMVLSSRIEGFYNKDKRKPIIEDMAIALKNEVNELEKAGASMIQVDEPFLSTGVADIKTARTAIKILTEDLEVPVSMHVCGDVGEILKDILNFPVQVIDCEFAGVPSNIDSLEQNYSGSKKIGFGCINTKTEKLEEPDQILNLIKRGINIVGEENMMVDPDCGMRMLPRDVAFNKLKNMEEAVGWL